eukprot:1752966-Rhodomonas_salina.4
MDFDSVTAVSADVSYAREAQVSYPGYLARAPRVPRVEDVGQQVRGTSTRAPRVEELGSRLR